MSLRDLFSRPETTESPVVADEIRKTTCYMCACRCGIDVFLRDGKIRYIQGNRDHPVNRGVLCAKGSAGIMQQYSPAKLRAPLKRTGPRGSGSLKEISWEEAIDCAVSWLKPIRQSEPRRLAFFSGRDQSQSFTGWWAQQFGTPNYAAHGGFCSVNMAAAGIYTMGGSFWEFGQPDWEYTKLLVIFGVAEDHDSNPIKLGLSRLKERGARIISVNPVRTGYSAIADEWFGITPGTDGLLISSLIRELLLNGWVDLEYMLRYTNAAHLVVNEDPDSAGLFARDSKGRALVWDRERNALHPWDRRPLAAALTGDYRLADGRTAKPAFDLIANKLLDEQYAPETVADRTGITAGAIRDLAAQLAHVAFDQAISIHTPWTDWHGQHHETMRGRPVSFHAMRGISAHSNGFQTCRLLHLLQIMLGTVECPGGFRFKPPYPKPSTLHPKPAYGNTPETALAGPHLGYPQGPEDLLVDDAGKPLRIDKAFSWEAPLSAHGMMHMVIANAAEGDPYPIDTLFLFMANMAWNSSMNTAGVIEMLERRNADGTYVIPHIICADAYASEMVAHADLVLPDTTYLERHDCISLLDRPICEPDAAADSIRWPVIEPDRDVRCFQSVLLDIGARLKLPGFVNADGKPEYADYADYIVRHERKPGIGPLAGWRGENADQSGRGRPNADQLNRYIANGGYWQMPVPEGARYFKPWNRAYQNWAVEMGFYDEPQHYCFDIYLESLRKFQLAAMGRGATPAPALPEGVLDRIMRNFEPVPTWYAPFEDEVDDDEDFPLHAITQRPAAMYHSWGSQNAWLRQIHGDNVLYVPGIVMRSSGLKEGGWAWVISRHGKIRVRVRRTNAVNEKTLWTWNAIGKRSGAWSLSPDAAESRKGFLLNHLISELLPMQSDGYRWSNSDPITGQAAWYDLRVRIEPADDNGPTYPEFPPLNSPVGQGTGDLAYGEDWTP